MAPPSTGLTFRRSAWNMIKPMPEELSTLGDNYFKFSIMQLARGYYLADPLAVMRLHGDNAFSMQRSGFSRFPEDIKVAFALRSNFPNLEGKADSLISITMLNYWRVKGRDHATSEQFRAYLRKSSTGRKARIYGGALLRRCKQFLRGIYAARIPSPQSSSVPITLSSQIANRKPHQ